MSEFPGFDVARAEQAYYRAVHAELQSTFDAAVAARDFDRAASALDQIGRVYARIKRPDRLPVFFVRQAI